MQASPIPAKEMLRLFTKQNLNREDKLETGISKIWEHVKSTNVISQNPKRTPVKINCFIGCSEDSQLSILIILFSGQKHQPIISVSPKTTSTNSHRRGKHPQATFRN